MLIGLVHNWLEPGLFTLISVGLIRYSCGHILDHHEPIPTKFALWMFFIMLQPPSINGIQNFEMKKKKSFCDVITSVLYGHNEPSCDSLKYIKAWNKILYMAPSLAVVLCARDNNLAPSTLVAAFSENSEASLTNTNFTVTITLT